MLFLNYSMKASSLAHLVLVFTCLSGTEFFDSSNSRFSAIGRLKRGTFWRRIGYQIRYTPKVEQLAPEKWMVGRLLSFGGW